MRHETPAEKRASALERLQHELRLALEQLHETLARRPCLYESDPAERWRSKARAWLALRAIEHAYEARERGIKALNLGLALRARRALVIRTVKAIEAVHTCATLHAPARPIARERAA